MGWSAPTDWEAVCRRASGRRRWNAVRRFLRDMRRIQVMRLMVTDAYSLFARGSQKRIAAALGVSESTISRDLVGIMHLCGDLSRRQRCPTCGARHFTQEELWRLDEEIEAALGRTEKSWGLEPGNPSGDLEATLDPGAQNKQATSLRIEASNFSGASPYRQPLPAFRGGQC